MDPKALAEEFGKNMNNGPISQDKLKEFYEACQKESQASVVDDFVQRITQNLSDQELKILLQQLFEIEREKKEDVYFLRDTSLTKQFLIYYARKNNWFEKTMREFIEGKENCFDDFAAQVPQELLELLAKNGVAGDYVFTIAVGFIFNELIPENLEADQKTKYLLFLKFMMGKVVERMLNKAPEANTAEEFLEHFKNISGLDLLNSLINYVDSKRENYEKSLVSRYENINAPYKFRWILKKYVPKLVAGQMTSYQIQMLYNECKDLGDSEALQLVNLILPFMTEANISAFLKEALRLEKEKEEKKENNPDYDYFLRNGNLAMGLVTAMTLRQGWLSSILEKFRAGDKTFFDNIIDEIPEEFLLYLAKIDMPEKEIFHTLFLVLPVSYMMTDNASQYAAFSYVTQFLLDTNLNREDVYQIKMFQDIIKGTIPNADFLNEFIEKFAKTEARKELSDAVIKKYREVKARSVGVEYVFTTQQFAQEDIEIYQRFLDTNKYDKASISLLIINLLRAEKERKSADEFLRSPSFAKDLLLSKIREEKWFSEVIKKFLAGDENFLDIFAENIPSQLLEYFMHSHIGESDVSTVLLKKLLVELLPVEKRALFLQQVEEKKNSYEPKVIERAKLFLEDSSAAPVIDVITLLERYGNKLVSGTISREECLALYKACKSRNESDLDLFVNTVGSCMSGDNLLTFLQIALEYESKAFTPEMMLRKGSLATSLLRFCAIRFVWLKDNARKYLAGDVNCFKDLAKNLPPALLKCLSNINLPDAKNNLPTIILSNVLEAVILNNDMARNKDIYILGQSYFLLGKADEQRAVSMIEHFPNFFPEKDNPTVVRVVEIFRKYDAKQRQSLHDEIYDAYQGSKSNDVVISAFFKADDQKRAENFNARLSVYQIVRAHAEEIRPYWDALVESLKSIDSRPLDFLEKFKLLYQIITKLPEYAASIDADLAATWGSSLGAVFGRINIKDAVDKVNAIIKSLHAYEIPADEVFLRSSITGLTYFATGFIADGFTTKPRENVESNDIVARRFLETQRKSRALNIVAIAQAFGTQLVSGIGSTIDFDVLIRELYLICDGKDEKDVAKIIELIAINMNDNNFDAFIERALKLEYEFKPGKLFLATPSLALGLIQYKAKRNNYFEEEAASFLNSKPDYLQHIVNQIPEQFLLYLVKSGIPNEQVIDAVLRVFGYVVMNVYGGVNPPAAYKLELSNLVVERFEKVKTAHSQDAPREFNQLPNKYKEYFKQELLAFEQLEKRKTILQPYWDAVVAACDNVNNRPHELLDKLIALYEVLDPFYNADADQCMDMIHGLTILFGKIDSQDACNKSMAFASGIMKFFELRPYNTPAEEKSKRIFGQITVFCGQFGGIAFKAPPADNIQPDNTVSQYITRTQSWAGIKAPKTESTNRLWRNMRQAFSKDKDSLLTIVTQRIKYNPEDAKRFFKKRSVGVFSGTNYRELFGKNPGIIADLILLNDPIINAAIDTHQLLNSQHFVQADREKLLGLKQLVTTFFAPMQSELSNLETVVVEQSEAAQKIVSEEDQLGFHSKYKDLEASVAQLKKTLSDLGKAKSVLGVVPSKERLAVELNVIQERILKLEVQVRHIQNLSNSAIDIDSQNRQARLKEMEQYREEIRNKMRTVSDTKSLYQDILSQLSNINLRAQLRKNIDKIVALCPAAEAIKIVEAINTAIANNKINSSSDYLRCISNISPEHYAGFVIDKTLFKQEVLPEIKAAKKMAAEKKAMEQKAEAISKPDTKKPKLGRVPIN